jgi:hypothetical protein
MRSTTLRWIGLALLGIVIAAGVAVAASSLVSHQIGLASEPLSAGDALAPVATHAVHGGKHRRKTPVKPATTAPSTEPSPPSESSPAPPETSPPAPETISPAPEPTPSPAPAPSSGGHDGGGDTGGEGNSGGGGADD